MVEEAAVWDESENDFLAHHFEWLGLAVLEFEVQFDREFFNFQPALPSSFRCVCYECSWHSIKTLSKQSSQTSPADIDWTSWWVRHPVNQRFFCVLIKKILTELSWMNFPLLHDESTAGCETKTENCWLVWRLKFRTARTKKIATLYFCEIVIANSEKQEGIYFSDYHRVKWNENVNNVLTKKLF